MKLFKRKSKLSAAEARIAANLRAPDAGLADIRRRLEMPGLMLKSPRPPINLPYPFYNIEPRIVTIYIKEGEL
ncbi:MAG: hypothetical protein LBL66_09315 [Clostridiales bacterium]|jgi:hypothetical protein|nr:hypothetical protein [Clostridiales bacterium]